MEPKNDTETSNEASFATTNSINSSYQQQEQDTARKNVTTHLRAQAQQEQQSVTFLRDIDDDGLDNDDDDELSVNTIGSEIVRRVVTRKRFWSAIAVCSFSIGFGCLITAMNLSETTTKGPRRMYTKR